MSISFGCWFGVFLLVSLFCDIFLYFLGSNAPFLND